jgi:hypothetical protein
MRTRVLRNGLLLFFLKKKKKKKKTRALRNGWLFFEKEEGNQGGDKWVVVGLQTQRQR